MTYITHITHASRTQHDCYICSIAGVRSRLVANRYWQGGCVLLLIGLIAFLGACAAGHATTALGPASPGSAAAIAGAEEHHHAAGADQPASVTAHHHCPDPRATLADQRGPGYDPWHLLASGVAAAVTVPPRPRPTSRRPGRAPDRRAARYSLLLALCVWRV